MEYAGHCEIRRVSHNGCVTWHSDHLFIATPLAGEDIAFEEVDEGVWTIRFATLTLGRFDERRRQIHPVAAFSKGALAGCAGSRLSKLNKLSPMSPD